MYLQTDRYATDGHCELVPFPINSKLCHGQVNPVAYLAADCLVALIMSEESPFKQGFYFRWGLKWHIPA